MNTEKLLKDIYQTMTPRNVSSMSAEEIFLEYKVLFKAFKKLAKRYDKSNKITDSLQKQSFMHNLSLQEDKKNILLTAKNKIAFHASMHKNKNKNCQELLLDNRKTILALEVKLRNLQSKYDDLVESQ